MREIRTYGATSGDWKRSYAMWTEAPALPVNGYSPHSRPPRQSSTLPVFIAGCARASSAACEKWLMSNRNTKKACGCPVAAFQRMINGKYKIRILWDLRDCPLRYGEIRSGLLRGAAGSREIAPRVLSRELKALTEIGLIVRKDYGVVPPKVEYRLTSMGRSFIPVIAVIQKWGIRHLGDARGEAAIDRLPAA
jgi:DNA-binding HxlR family transcriptional regulator